VNKNITQRMDEDEEQRVTDETSWILLGMPNWQRTRRWRRNAETAEKN